MPPTGKPAEVDSQIQVFCETAPAFSSCSYVLMAAGTDQGLIIDPGNPDEAPLMELLDFLRVRQVPFIVLTHEHFDHIAGVEALRNRFGSRLVCSLPCAEAIGDPKSNLSFYKDGKGMSCGPADWICERDGWELPWSAGIVRLVHTPGHSPGGLCAAIAGHLFTGDTLMGNRRTPTHLPRGSSHELRKSMNVLLDQFGPETIVHPGHGPAFSLGTVDPHTVLGTVAG